MKQIVKSLSAEISPNAKGFSAIITAETLDRDGEVLIPAGMNAKEFEKNPVLFWNHDYAKPIGRATNLKRRELDITADFVFAQRPDGYQGEFFPEVAAALVGQGIVKGISIGYAPEEGGIRRASDIDKKKYGSRVHTVYSRWKLHEISLAPLPANQDALITAVRKGMLSPVAAKSFFGVEMPTRERIVISVPLPAVSTKAARKPIDVGEITRREIARAKGAIWA
jgi:HK97 family phage prohead protease